jgi:hypothetical protein
MVKKIGEKHIHGDQRVGRCDNERVEWDDGGVRIGFECPDDLHFIPSVSSKGQHPA